jgi:hypothetical protein
MIDFDICAKKHKGNPESLAARATTNASRDRLLVLKAIKEAGQNGMTCDELEQALSMSHQTCSARCSELKRDRMVRVAAGFKRKTRTGCSASVLIAI